MLDELLRGRLLDLMAAKEPDPVLESLLVAMVEESPTRIRFALEVLEDTGFAIRTSSALGDCWTRNV